MGTDTETPIGLTSAEARERLRRDGPNQLVPEGRRWPRAITWIVKALVDPMALLLLAATPVYWWLGDRLDAIVTIIVLVPIAAVGVALEARAERALEALARLAAPTARVYRDGAVAEVPSREVVVGDHLLIREGDVVPADAELAEGQQVMLDESALTGESLPLAKDADGDRAVYAGTTVLSGRGRAVVTAVGAATRYGALGALVAGISQAKTPLQQVTSRLVRWLAVVAILVCLAVVALQIGLGRPTGEAVIAGISLAIAAVPEEFPMVFTLFLGLGAWRLARRQALVRRLPGVETLGSTTVICADKTGTLTLGRLDVSALVVGGRVLRAEDGGEEERALLEAAVLASEPDPYDPLDRAIVSRAQARGIDVARLHAGELLRDHPFDPGRKLLTHVWRTESGARACTKGALEGVLTTASAPEVVRQQAQAANAALGGEGMRLIAVAAGPTTAEGDRARDEAALEVLGLIAFADPPRPEVEAALRECREAGVRVVMITGDHPLTAHAIANQLGLPHDDAHAVTTGDDLDAADEAALAAIVAEASIFARIRPEQKHRIVRALRKQGEVVAMTGDGVNDAAALREADIGVAMGQRGTEVARSAATIVLLDDNFSTIVAAVREGRRIFENLSRAFAYLIAFHVPLVLVALVAPLSGRPLLLLPIHLLLLELVVHPTVALVFENDPPSPDLMRRPPRARAAGLLGASSGRSIAAGASLGLACLGLYLGELSAGASAEAARAAAFATMVLGQVLLVLTERSPEQPIWRAKLSGNAVLWPVLGGTVGGLALALALPPLAGVLRFEPLGARQALLACGLAVGAVLWTELLKRQRSPPASTCNVGK